jgi:DNA-nicking Smr family endonuclease
MKRGRGTAPVPASFEALAQFRRNLAAQAATARQPPEPKAAVPPAPADGATVFRRAVADVVPLPPPNRALHRCALPKPIPLQRLRDEQQVLHDALSDPWDWDAALSTGEELVFCRPGVPASALRKLRRGGWVIRGELDLHGHTGDEARIALAGFLNRCMLEERRCVRIIHGKGHGSKNRLPVLKNKVRHWLMQRDDVLAFCQARSVDGGTGAVIVLLRSSSR